MSKSYPINRRRGTYIYSPALFFVLVGIAVSGFAQSMGAPRVETESPADGAIGVALDAEVRVEFDREVTARDLEQVEIRDADDAPVDGVSADLSENVLTIEHDGFDYLTEYTVIIPSNTVENIRGVGNGTFRWSFTTIQGAPVVISENPVDGSVGVALEVTVNVEFDQDVIAEDLDDVEIRDAEDDELEGVVPHLEGNVLALTHPGLNPATEYTVIIPEGTVENEHEYENEEYSWSFTTIQVPVLAEEESPPDGAGGVALDEDVSVGFNQDVSEGDLSQVAIQDADGNPVSDISADLDENVLEIDHDDFGYFTEYTVIIPGGTVVDNQGAGNEEFTWSFTTIRGAPVVISETPPDGSVGVALDATVSVEFDQNVIEEDLDDVEIRDAEDDELEGVSAYLEGNVLTLTHPGFNPATEYTVEIPEGTVENEHEYENEEYSWSFTTIREAPAVVNESPQDGANGVALDEVVSSGFDKEVFANSLENVELRDSDGNIIENVSANLDDNVLIINHPGFDNFTMYTATIPEGTVVNADGVGNEAYSWSFTSIRGAPVVINELPDDGAEEIALDAEINAEFDQDVSEGNFDNVDIRDSEDNQVGINSVELDDNILRIHQEEFEGGAEFTVNIPEGTVVNDEGTGNEEFSWSFITRQLQSAPVGVNETPSDGASGVALDAEVSIGFSQDVTEANLSSVEIQDSDGNPVGEVSADLDNSELIISHADFAHFTEYTVIIPEGTVENADGVGNEEFMWSFTTIQSAPIAVNETPADGSERVALDSGVSVEFDQDVNEVDPDQVAIQDSNGNEVEEVSAELEGDLLIIAHPGFNNFADYTVIIPEGMVENTDGVGNEEFSWSFTTIRAAPLAVNETPSDGSEEVAPDVEISVEFDQQVSEADLDQIEIRDAENNEVSDVSAELVDNVVTISHADLDFHTGYTVIIPVATVENEDEVGNEEFSWSFTTQRGAPVVENKTPPDGSTGVSLDAIVSVAFDQDINEENLDIIEIRDSDGNQTEVRSIEIVRNVMIIAHADFEYLTEYQVIIPDGAVVNDHGYENEEFSWSFTTLRLLSPPLTENEIPSDSATGVPLDAEVSVRFNQDVSEYNLDQVAIIDEDDNALEEVSAELEDNELIITHPGFSHFTEYRVTVPEGTVENADEIVNEEFIWRFVTIRDGPVAENESPADGSERISLDANVSVGFDQEVSEGDLNQVEIRDSDGNAVEGVSAALDENELTISHSGLDHYTEYTVTIPEGTVENADEVGNDEFTWSFTTIRAAPVVVNESPADGSERISLDANVSVGFDQEVSEGDLNQVEIRDSDGNAVEGVSAALDENELTISHSGLDHYTEYTVTIPEGTVENADEVGNEAYSWNFTTTRSAPIAGSETPADGSDGVSLDSDVSVGFDQEVTLRESASIEIRDADNNEVDGISLNLDDNTLWVEHDGFDFFTEYTVTIPSGTVENEDGVGNETFSWSFTTLQRMSAPQVENTSPQEGAEGVSLDEIVSAGFNQNVNEADLSGVQIQDNQNNNLGNVSASLEDNELTISHQGFNHFTEYTVIIPEGSVENSDEVANEAFSWSFTTIREAPFAINISPDNDLDGVALDASVRAEFDQNIDAANPDQVEIRNTAEDEAVEVSVVVDDDIISIHHTGFDNLTRYRVSIPEGTVENADGVGNEEITWSFTTIVAAPRTVRLTAPEDGADNVELQPELIWEQSDVAETYHLQLTSGTDFDADSEIEESVLEDTVFAVDEDLEEDQTYRWRVRAENAGGTGDWSEVRTFSTRPPPLVDQVVLSEPADSAGSISPEAELVWEPADQASHYNVEIATDPEFEEPVFTANEVEATNLVSDMLHHYTIYYWRVQGESDIGAGEWSEPGVFITLAEPPELQFPSDDARQISIAPRLSWNSSYESTRFEVRLGNDESFSQVHQNFDTDQSELSVNGLAAGTEYHWQVRLADELTTSDWSVPRAFTTREDPVEESVQVRIDFQPENRSSIASEDFRLIGLPGGESIALDEIFTGEYKDDWRAFTDTGEDEDYLEEFNPEGTSFNFGSGRGYWVFNREPVDVEKNIAPVELDEGDTYSISLNQGWNIIANPFNQKIEWEDITDLNEIEAPLYGYDRVFESVEWLDPLRGYYFYNDPDLDQSSLQIPYGEQENRRPKEQDAGLGTQQSKIASSPENEQSAIRLLAEFYNSNDSENRIRTGVELLFDQNNAEVPFPSLEMAHYGVVLENPGDSNRIHQSMSAGYETSGTEYGLRVKAPVGRKVKWQADFEEMPESSRILLVNPVTRATYLLADGDEVELSVTEPEVRYKLFTGDEAYLREIRDDQLPGEVTLKGNYPNPFNPITTIRYALVEESRVNIEVYNMLGQRVATLVDENQDAGWHTVQFDGSRLASGAYLYRLVTGGQVKTGKMMLVK